MVRPRFSPSLWLTTTTLTPGAAPTGMSIKPPPESGNPVSPADAPPIVTAAGRAGRAQHRSRRREVRLARRQGGARGVAGRAGVRAGVDRGVICRRGECRPARLARSPRPRRGARERRKRGRSGRQSARPSGSGPSSRPPRRPRDASPPARRRALDRPRPTRRGLLPSSQPPRRHADARFVGACAASRGRRPGGPSVPTSDPRAISGWMPAPSYDIRSRTERKRLPSRRSESRACRFRSDRRMALA